MKIIKDGDAYCVQKDNFKDLQESKDYFFIDEEEHKRFIKSIQRTIVVDELVHWARFFNDPSMNGKTPTERLRERIDKLLAE